MRRSGDFRLVLRSGDRARLDRLVVHQLTDRLGDDADRQPGSRAPLVGLVVSRSVGNSVVRHRVSRRLRAQLAQRLDRLPAGSGTVIRALPPAATASSADLGEDLDRGLRRLSERAARLPRSAGAAR
jgi:ribonuclease P protein component